MGVKISAKVEDRLFLESDNGCAVCGIKDARALTIHHINHDTDTPHNSYDNLIVLCHNCHHMYHDGKGLKKSEIIKIKRRLIHKTMTPFGINALKIASRNGDVLGSPFTLLYLVELGLLKKGSIVSFVQNMRGEDVDMDAFFEVTDKGKEFYKKWIA